MDNRLSKENLDEWYRKLNVARTQTGVDLSTVDTPTVGVSTVTPINQLVTDIRNARANNPLLELSDDSTVDFTAGEVITDKHTIDDTIQSLLRVCANVSCHTILITEQKDVNGADYNGTKQNGNSHSCSDWYMCAHNGGGFGGLQDPSNALNGGAANWIGVWGTSSETNWHLSHSKGSYQHGGNSNSYYDPATATYTAKNYYSKEEADNR